MIGALIIVFREVIEAGLIVGIVLAAVLFGALYQGGAELAFDMPRVSRDLVVVIQGVVILFAGALEHMFRPQVEALFSRRTLQPAPA